LWNIPTIGHPQLWLRPWGEKKGKKPKEKKKCRCRQGFLTRIGPEAKKKPARRARPGGINKGTPGTRPPLEKGKAQKNQNQKPGSRKKTLQPKTT